MESRIENTPTATATGNESPGTTDKLLEELKGMVQRAEQKAVERAKAADRIVRDHPYQTIGLAFGLGLLIGILARRK
jgi:ElaB/YqjD/DUF883 family membrane-anchored ribosome-binding protein